MKTIELKFDIGDKAYLIDEEIFLRKRNLLQNL